MTDTLRVMLTMLILEKSNFIYYLLQNINFRYIGLLLIWQLRFY